MPQGLQILTGPGPADPGLKLPGLLDEGPDHLLLLRGGAGESLFRPVDCEKGGDLLIGQAQPRIPGHAGRKAAG